MKKFILILCLLLLTGCSNKYTLVISNDKLEESINVVIPKSEIPILTEVDKKANIPLDDEYTPFIQSNQQPFYNNSSIMYKKDLNEYDDKYVINYSYTYKPEEFSNSNILRRCFENYGYSYKDDYYLRISGRFYCAYSDTTEINIKVKNRVLKSNADKKHGNVYTWYITKDNSDNVNIELKVSRGSMIIYLLPYIIVLFLLIIASIFIVKFFRKRKTLNEF